MQKALLAGILLLLVPFLVFVVPTVLAVITVVSFDVTPGQNQAVLRWVTASEVDHAGFFVHGSTDPAPLLDSMQYRLNTQIITSTGTTLTGATYTFTHTNLTNGTTYYYWLEAVSMGGDSEFIGPRSVIPGTTPTPGTATRTITPTLSTPGVGTPSPTTPPAAQTPTRTRTATPRLSPTTGAGSPSPTVQTLTPTVDETALITTTVTATLIPLPSLTLLFPAITPTLTETLPPGDQSMPGTVVSTPSPAPAADGLSPTVVFIGVLIVVIWLLLGAFLFIYIRRLGY